MTPAPNDAVLGQPDVDRFAASIPERLYGSMHASLRDEIARLARSHAALRAKLAERDRLLRQINTAHEAADRCQCEMYLDCQHARLQREAREALRAALEGGPR